MNEQWTEQLRQKMADYQRPAPEVSWDEIDRALTAGKTARTRMLWLQRAAAAAVVLLIAAAAYWTIDKGPQTAENRLQTAENKLQTAENKLQATDSKLQVLCRDLREAPEHQWSARKRQSRAQSSKHEQARPQIRAQRSKPEVRRTEEPETRTEEPETRTEEFEARNEEPEVRNEEPNVQSSMHNAQHTMHNGQWSMVQAQSSKLTAKVYMSNMIADSRHSASFYTTTSKTSYSSHTEYIPHEVPVVYIDESNGGGDAITVYEEVTVYDTIITTKMVQTDQHIHHRQPIRFGLSLRYQLDDRWSVESGLSYTRLSSDITTVEAGMTTVTEQRLNYIGLPLNVGYDLWKNRTFGLYVTAGGMIEKRLGATPWQFSLNAAAGAEYRLNDHFSLYAEPGLGYYFPDGSATPTIYQDRPLNFNLSLGLRFHLK